MELIQIENVRSFLIGLDYSKPRNEYEEGWHSAVKCVKEYLEIESKRE